MNWQQVCDDPKLKDLPFKIELNAFGQIIMSPASNWHGFLQTRICILLDRLLSSGQALTECSIQTSDNVKVADVAWLSDDFHAIHKFETPFTQAPEICVEILSPSNSPAEMTIKRALYFGAGAKEVWQCDQDGAISYYSPCGLLEQSEICPAFPQRM
jgi:Uma2 family endonuclease